jgi:hypothetical protein
MNFRKAQWIPLDTYVDGGTNFIVMARKNTRTGMLYFRVKRMTRKFHYVHLPSVGLDIKEQFTKLINTAPGKGAI